MEHTLPALPYAIDAETTPGPWTLEVGIDEWGSSYAYIAEVDTDVPTQYTKDAAFIAEVRTLAPVVAEQVKALEAQLAEERKMRENALARHKNVGGECNECIQVDEYELVEGKRYPCPTVQALTSETEASDE